MEPDPQRDEHRKRLSDALSELSSIDVDALKRTDDLGRELDFSKGTVVFERTLSLFRKLAESNLDSLPTPTLSRLADTVEQARNDFNGIREFTTNQGNPATVRDTLIHNIESQYESRFSTVAPIIAYSVRIATDFARMETRAAETVNRLRSLEKEAAAKAEETEQKTEAALRSVREAAAKIGVSQHSTHFAKEARAHEERKKRWQRATVGITAGLFGLACLNFWWVWNDASVATTGEIVQVALAKILLFAVLSYGLVWSSRIFRAESHNVVVNQHRQNALNSFETFVSAAGDESTKEAVLLQATRSIFAHQPSGFASEGNESGSSSQLTEVVRSFSNPPGGE